MAVLIIVAVPVYMLWFTPQTQTDVNADTVQPLPTEDSLPQTAP